ncbi:MAG: hypothetical protein IJW09_02790 [Clostridia bacterium]|nr:hypothetical protein [Clostridia bacterium]
MKFKKVLLRITLCIISLLLMLTSVVGCSSKGETLMQIGKQELTVNMYELLLSRMKGTLTYNDYPTDSESFWDTIISTQGATYNDYFCLSMQQEAKMMLVKLYLFEEVYKLTLPEKNYAAIDEYINDALELIHDGSKTAFNKELSLYGVNIDMLRENYIIEDKIEYLKSHISTQTGDAARDEYYKENYVCFRQILLPLYEFLYVTDENGDTVYYHEGTERIYYDTTGTTKTGTDGKPVVDKNGDTIYYTADGKIAYNSTKGVTQGLDKDNDGYTDYVMFDEERAIIVKDQANKLMELIQVGDFSTFEDYGEKLSEKEVWNAYPNGIYINKNKNYSIAYLDDIQKALTNMAVGDTQLIKSDNAYHLIMKYTAEDQAYKNKENQDWFEEFEDEVVTDILNAMCQKYLEQVTVDEKALAEAMDMKSVGANTEY